MDKAKKILYGVIIGAILLSSILMLVMVCTNLAIKTLEKQKVQWECDRAKKEYELVLKQIENEKLRYKVYKTLEADYD
jgi:hypothetical protein